MYDPTEVVLVQRRELLGAAVGPVNGHRSGDRVVAEAGGLHRHASDVRTRSRRQCANQSMAQLDRSRPPPPQGRPSSQALPLVGPHRPHFGFQGLELTLGGFPVLMCERLRLELDSEQRPAVRVPPHERGGEPQAQLHRLRGLRGTHDARSRRARSSSWSKMSRPSRSPVIPLSKACTIASRMAGEKTSSRGSSRSRGPSHSSLLQPALLRTSGCTNTQTSKLVSTTISKPGTLLRRKSAAADVYIPIVGSTALSTSLRR